MDDPSANLPPDAAQPVWPLADDEVRLALEAAFADGSWGRYHGPHGERLTAALAEYHNVPHVALCSSGTIAVELALRGVGVTAGDEVILPAYDFPGNFRAIEAIGARPVLVDIDPRTWCLDARELPAAIGPKTKAIVASHMHGGLADMPAIVALAREHKLLVVEDVCQSPGARLAGRVAGAWGDASVLSFGGSKPLTAGRGGAVLTPHADVLQRIKVFTQRGNDAFPLSEMQAAVLLPQLARLDERNAIRAARAAQLVERLADLRSLQPLSQIVADPRPSYYKLAWLWNGDDSPRDRDAIVAAARGVGIPLDAGFRGFTLRGDRRCRKIGDLPHASAAAANTLILHHPILLSPPAIIDQLAARMRGVLAPHPAAS